jgi:aminoglycoside 6'-N-acetyltransferase
MAARDRTPPDRVSFRPLTRGDFPLLGRWLTAPHVAAWWTEPADPGSLEGRYAPAVDGIDPTEVFIATIGGRPVGLVQRYRLADEPGWTAALAPAGVPAGAFGIDYLVGDPRHTGRGIGTMMIGALVVDSWDRYPDCRACVVAVHADNRRSWRALERSGFRRTWAGRLATEDAADVGPQVVYVRRRPAD